MIDPQVLALVQQLQQQPVSGHANTTPISNVSQVKMSTGDQSQPDRSHLLRTLMYVLQATDALNTSDYMKRTPGAFETNPMMKGLAHPGNPLSMLLGYGLEDAALGAMPKKEQGVGDLLQILSNMFGLGKTEASRAKNADLRRDGQYK